MAQIFIVDDSISVRKALEITFKRHALSSLSAVSGEEALETLQNQTTSFDLLMVDVIMPGMSGLELCATLRQQARFQSVPVILMSGNVDDDIRQQARDAGATAVLRKPFSPDELIPMVEGLLPARAEAAAPARAPAEEVPTPTAPEPVALAPQEPARPEADPRGQPGTPASRALEDAGRLISHYQSGGHAEALALLNAEHRLLGNVGQPLDPKLLTFAVYFVNTARVIGQQFMDDALQTVTLRYLQRDLILHVHPEFTLIVLTRAEAGGSKVLN
ncbi:response regulator [Deinococcus koreensis]|nr:response regulator [Deinococcus koreensis]